MSALAVKRRALATVCQAQSSRLVHSSSVNQATVYSSASLAGPEPEEVILAPIFDIFDAPSRLAESNEFIREKYQSSSSGVSRVTPEVSVFGAHPSRQLPTSLPAPVVFDGPAKPKNAALAFRSRLRQAGVGPTPQPRINRPASRSFSSSEPLVQMFEGPAKITRYHHQPSSQRQKSSPYLLALGVAGAVGCATLAQNTENSPS